jgi:hypothetical protein
VRTAIAWALLLVWFAAVLALSGLVWMRARRATLDKKRAADRRRTTLDRRREERHFERVVREATAAGATVAVARRGSNPTRVTWSDGSVWFFYDDDERYEAAKRRGVAVVDSTYIGPAPAVGEPRPTTNTTS